MSEHHVKQGSSRHRAKPSKERLNGHLRVALWYVYEGRCAYTGERIAGLEHVVIDHVLPERLADNDDERQQALAAFGLPSDFQISGLSVPSVSGEACVASMVANQRTERTLDEAR